MRKPLDRTCLDQQGEKPLYHLLGLNSDGAVAAYDGPHGSPNGVAQALHLYEQLGLKDDNLKYVMAKTSTRKP
jgi:hypothetical protein